MPDQTWVVTGAGFEGGVGAVTSRWRNKGTTALKEILPLNLPDFCFFLCQLRLRQKGFSALPPAPPPSRWKQLHWPLLSIASICEQLSLLQMEMRPKIATNGAMPLDADVSALSLVPEYTCPIKLTLTPSADRTDISFTKTLCSGNLFPVPARGTTVTSTRGK